MAKLSGKKVVDNLTKMYYLKIEQELLTSKYYALGKESGLRTYHYEIVLKMFLSSPSYELYTMNIMLHRNHLVWSEAMWRRD